jgi:hypothetical protein
MAREAIEKNTATISMDIIRTGRLFLGPSLAGFSFIGNGRTGSDLENPPLSPACFLHSNQR